NCTIVITFSPTVAGTTYAGNLSIGYADGTPTSRSVDTPVTGVGGNPASLAISDGATFDYGTVAIGAHTDHTFIVTNSGDVAGVVTNAAVAGLPYSVVSSSGCASIAPSGGTCTIVVRFAPSASTTST